MNFNRILLGAALAALSLNLQAGAMSQPYVEQGPWSVIGGLGYTWYNFGYSGGALADPSAQSSIGDGQTAIGRFAIARDVTRFQSMQLGLELGVQSGNTMRLNIPQSTLTQLGGMPIQANIKPMLDLLATARTEPLMNTPVFGVVKAGVAYRRMQINDRVTVNDLSQLGFEVQAGIGTDITKKAKLSLVYQGIFDGSTNFTVNTTAGTGHVSNIPAQNGVLLNLSYAL